MKSLICKIPDQENSYAIEIGDGLLYAQASYLSTLGSRFAIITDDRVAKFYGTKLQESLSSYGLETQVFSFPHGEAYKTRVTKELIEDRLFESCFGKDSCVIALGGGVATDMAGFIASTYCRGVPFVMIPTTLLGMVDASIGGKTGVNVPYGKNMIGAIYQPKKVVIDSLLLKSLPKKEVSNGFVEMIKHGLIADDAYFMFLEKQYEQLINLNAECIQHAIIESCRIKKEIVETDEKENGKRRLLNFGHTIGHALEHVSRYSLSHGEAVAIGLMVESYLSMKLGALSVDSLTRIKNVFKHYNISFLLPSDMSVEDLLDAMTLDKKSLNRQPRFVIIEAIGKPREYESAYCTSINHSLLKEALKWMKDDLCRD